MKKGFISTLMLSFVFFLPSILMAQFTISGTVMNTDGEVLKYASVFTGGGEYGASTDEKGMFKIENVEEGEYEIKATFLSYANYSERFYVGEDIELDIVLEGIALNIGELEIISSRVEKNNPIAHTDVDREEIAALDFGKDIPVLLQNTPSMVITSDAGNGVGYTSMRIRGFDQSRINVNINGVPLNDAESQNVFFVDIPDLLSSTEDVQIQRGVGSSNIGPGSFGASVSLNTNRRNINPYVQLSAGYGSYNTQNYTGMVGTGLMNDKYAIDFRYSLTKSDGYLDRATSDLNSYYLSAARFGPSSSLRFISFSGHETTYQAWYGTPKEKLFGTEEELMYHYNRQKGEIYLNAQDSTNLFSSDRKYNYYSYDNQVDNYTQSHYQLHYAKSLSDDLSFKSAMYSSVGKGYYEEFKYKAKFSDYLLPYSVVGEDTLTRGDIVRRRTLDNNLYGAFVNTNYNINDNQKIEFGLAGSTYSGDHFGTVLSAESKPNVDTGKKYYNSEGNKNEFSSFLKYNIGLMDNLNVFTDLQYRFVNYNTKGTDNDQQVFDLDHSYNFFNPKVGMSYQIKDNSSLNLFVGMSNREPSRNDFVDVDTDASPEHENIIDYELAYRYNTESVFFDANVYFMDYKNQLVLRGDLNDSGASVRENVEDSYRTGIELSNVVKWTERLKSKINFTYSQNRIADYNQSINNYNDGSLTITNFKDTPIAFSPDIVSNVGLDYNITKDWSIGWNTKYVSEQHLDNTGDTENTIPAYNFSDFTMSYVFKSKRINFIRLGFQLNNVFDQLYVSNGYTYSYIYGDKVTETFYFPQAGRNFNLKMTIRI